MSHRIEGRILRVPADPRRLAGRLRRCGAPDVGLLFDAEACKVQRVSYVTAFADDESEQLDPFVHCEGSKDRFGTWPRWLGCIPYEARRQLERPEYRKAEERGSPFLERPLWRRYPAMARVDHASGRVMVVGESSAVQRLAEALQGDDRAPSACRATITEAHAPNWHVERVGEAVKLILAGDLYQVNLARRLDVRLEQGEAFDVFDAMTKRAGGAFSAYLELGRERSVVSTSPELLLDARCGHAGRFERLATEPIKGTRPRGWDAVSDRALRAQLDDDPKERAELAMIVDVERNDLGSIAEVGSVRIVRPAHVVGHHTVWHRKVRLTASVRSDVSRHQVITAMVPSGSVTGAPKVRAMEVIAQLERERRGLYTGGHGYVTRDGSMRLGMSIRTMVFSHTHGHYWTGGGIVMDSDPERELEETRWKAKQLEKLMGDGRD